MSHRRKIGRLLDQLDSILVNTRRLKLFNYPTHKQEMLTIVECMKHWYPQRMGIRFEILTDCAPLQHWKTQQMLFKRQLRWLEFLSDVDFDIWHILRVFNTAADVLSRYPFAYVNDILTIEAHLGIIRRINGHRSIFQNPKWHTWFDP